MRWLVPLRPWDRPSLLAGNGFPVSDLGPLIGKEDVFENAYRNKFRLLVGGEGEVIQYERDRVAIDIGIHLTTPDGAARRASHTRIWFQLKGVHKQTLPLVNFLASCHVTVRVQLEQLRFWFQLKGVHKQTLPLVNFLASCHVTVRVQLEQLRFWFASQIGRAHV